jgi:general L-amino acid transport system substrate-binding protein
LVYLNGGEYKIPPSRQSALSPLSDQSQLYALKTTLKDPSSAIILKDIISKEPLGPVVRQGDDKWFNIVKWSLNAMIGAEEFGINSNVRWR